MFNAGTNTYTPNSNQYAYSPRSTNMNSFSSPSFMSRMGTGYNQLSGIQSTPDFQRMVTRATPVSAPTKSVMLGSGKSGMSISGASFKVPIKKRAKTKKEPLCDCGMPISQCKCDGHNHAQTSTKSKKKSTVKKSAPPDYTAIFSGAVQDFANRLKAKQKTYTPPPLYPQTYGATVNIGNDGGLSGYTSFYNQKGSKGSSMQKSMCKCGSGMTKSMCKCGSGGKNIKKARIRIPTPEYSARYRTAMENYSRNKPLKNELDNLPPTWGWTNDVAPSWRSVGVPQTQAQDALLTTLLDSAPASAKTKQKGSSAYARAKQTGSNAYTRAKNTVGASVQNATNAVLDATLKDIAMLPVTTTRYVARGVREIPQNAKNIARKTRNAMIAGKIYGRQYWDELTASKKPDKVALGIVGSPKINSFGRKMQNISMATKLYGKDYLSDLGKTTVRDVLNSARNLTPRQRKALLIGATAAGGLYAANEMFNKRNSIKKSVTRMGNHVVGGYHGKSINKAMKSSQSNTSNKYM